MLPSRPNRLTNSQSPAVSCGTTSHTGSSNRRGAPSPTPPAPRPHGSGRSPSSSVSASRPSPSVEGPFSSLSFVPHSSAPRTPRPSMCPVPPVWPPVPRRLAPLFPLPSIPSVASDPTDVCPSRSSFVSGGRVFARSSTMGVSVTLYPSLPSTPYVRPRDPPLGSQDSTSHPPITLTPRGVSGPGTPTPVATPTSTYSAPHRRLCRRADRPSLGVSSSGGRGPPLLPSPTSLSTPASPRK